MQPETKQMGQRGKILFHEGYARIEISTESFPFSPSSKSKNHGCQPSQLLNFAFDLGRVKRHNPFVCVRPNDTVTVLDCGEIARGP